MYRCERCGSDHITGWFRGSYEIIQSDGYESLLDTSDGDLETLQCLACGNTDLACFTGESGDDVAPLMAAFAQWLFHAL